MAGKQFNLHGLSTVIRCSGMSLALGHKSRADMAMQQGSRLKRQCAVARASPQRLGAYPLQQQLLLEVQPARSKSAITRLNSMCV